MDADGLKTLLAHGTPKVVVVGGGYVGLPFAVAAAQAHCDVVVLDIDGQKVAAINAGTSYIRDVDSDVLAELVRAGRVRATEDRKDAYAGANAVVVCVPTPLQASGDPDVSFVLSAVRGMLDRLDTPVLVSLESTVYPGFTREVVARELPGLDIYVSFSPERVDPGNRVWHTKNTPKVVGGINAAALDVALAFYRRVIGPIVPVSSADTAEMVKLLENTQRWVNIGLVNEVALQCHALGIDVWEVIDAAATKPFGFTKYTPGPGVGGHCIAIDPDYLAWKLRTMRQGARFIALAGAINRAMPAHVVDRLAEELNYMKKPVMGQRVLVLGVAYKPDVDDTRESPALDVIRELARRGALPAYYDPHVAGLHHEGFDMVSVEEPVDYSQYDAAVIVTHHAGVDYCRLVQECPLVFDTRGVTRALGAAPSTGCRLARL